MRVQVRDSVTEAIAEVPGTLLKPGMQTVVETLVKDIARDLITVSKRGQNYKNKIGPRLFETSLSKIAVQKRIQR